MILEMFCFLVGVSVGGAISRFTTAKKAKMDADYFRAKYLICQSELQDVQYDLDSYIESHTEFEMFREWVKSRKDGA